RGEGRRLQEDQAGNTRERGLGRGRAAAAGDADDRGVAHGDARDPRARQRLARGADRRTARGDVPAPPPGADLPPLRHPRPGVVARRHDARRPQRRRDARVREAAAHERRALQPDDLPLRLTRGRDPPRRAAVRDPAGPPRARSRDARLSAVARAGTPAGDSRGLLFLDTETTGLAGGTGTYTFLVGVGRLDGDRFIVEQYFMRDFDEEPALLAALVPLLEQAAGVVTFNGSAFDLPLLETRFVLARRRWPPRLPHLDLLRPAR